jgi:hypothetical protein
MAEIVRHEVLRRTSRRLCRRIKEHGLHQAHEDLAKFEPALARFIAHGCETVAGRLALSGAPTELNRHADGPTPSGGSSS